MEVLVAEDDTAGVSDLTQRIREWGHRVETAHTCKDALEKVKQKRFDLILLDMFLPDGKGYQLIPQFKKVCPDIGIIAMTGRNTRELERKVREQGIWYYMIKPFETEHLKSLLDHISQKRGQQKET